MTPPPHLPHSRRRFVQALVAAPFLGLIDGVRSDATPFAPSTDDHVDLNAVWRRAVDPEGQGIEQRWYAARLQDALPLPGTLEAQRIGNPVTLGTPWTGDIFDRSYFSAPEYVRYRDPANMKVPFFLQPESWYRGAAWYQRDIVVPATWRDRRVDLFLERPHWETQVWVGDRLLGRSDALHVPHVHDLGVLPPGTHRLTIRVDNRMIVEIGQNGHGLTDHTQGNWNGIAGRIELRSTAPAWIDHVALDPVFAGRTLTVRGTLQRLDGAGLVARAAVRFAGRTTTAPVTWVGDRGRFEAVFRPKPHDAAALPWDEFDRVLHDVDVRLENGERWTGRFGWRELAATSGGFTVNGRPAMLRGALDCSIYPLTGHPPTDAESWRRIMARVKEYGLNHLRFHSYCPPEAAFEAADEAGVFLQVETVWANQSSHIGGGLPVDAWIYAETDRILAAHGNHPSFVMMTHGNEPGSGDAPDGEKRRDSYLADYVRHYRARDPQRLWTAGAGWPTIAESQFHVTPGPRIQQWEEGLKSRINSRPPETWTDYREFIAKLSAPVVSHEIGQWCVYPNLAERRKYTGHLKARNFDIFADRLRDSGLLEHALEFHHASGRLQVLCYKEEIESALRTPGFGGFQLLGLQDFPGQGTALVGVLDPFWDDKGYTDAAEYRRFCAPTVMLARMPARVCTSGRTFPFTIDVAHFGAAPVEKASIAWKIADAKGAILAEGDFASRTIMVGNAPIGLKASPLLTVERATAARLVVSLTAEGRTIAENDWDLWVYPPFVAKRQTRIRRSDRIDAEVLDHVERGGTALIGLPRERVANHASQPVELGFSSIFWNTLWTQRQPPTTLGIMCDPQHPAFADFPTDPHTNWHWWYPIHRAGALRLDLLPHGVEPIVRIVDDWFTARPLALIVEVRIGKGRAVICGFAIDGPGTADPVSLQLVRSIERYMLGSSFRPSAEVSRESVMKLSLP